MNRSAIILCIAVVSTTPSAMAAPLPGPADSSRIQARPLGNGITTRAVPELPIQVLAAEAPPAGAKDIHFELNQVILEGNHAIDDARLGAVYRPFLGHKVTLDVAWVLAAEITKKYKEAGYFLSRAYVPAQTLEHGALRIRVLEGFVEDVTLNGEGIDLPLVRAWVARIKSYQPIRTDQLEQALLELNTLPDVLFRAVLNPPTHQEGKEGATTLELTGQRKKGTGSIRLDNNGSRYLGPYQLGANYQMALIPGQETSISLLSSAPLNELKSVSLRHAALVAPQILIDAGAGYTTATPGYLLKVQDVQSKAATLGTGVTYQWIRRRDESFSTRAGLEWRNADSDILNTPLSRDRLRMVRLNAAYDVSDSWNGYNLLSTTFTQGIAGLGASHAGNMNLSRAQATPNFRKLEFSGARLQGLGGGFQALLSTAGQMASGPLYSSEEFGYGGQSFGRAYDNSEIVGDHGLNGSLELRYTEMAPFFTITPMPYAFIDAGVVWNDDVGQAAEERGSSAGFGLRTQTDFGATANIGLAFPLSRRVSAPIYSNNGYAPRFYFDLSYGF